MCGGSTDDLLELAVAHELAHVLCNEKSEEKANRAAKTLLDAKPLSCGVTAGPKTRVEEMRKGQ